MNCFSKINSNPAMYLPTNTTNSFDQTATVSVVNLVVNSLQTESKANDYSREDGDRTQG